MVFHPAESHTGYFFCTILNPIHLVPATMPQCEDVNILFNYSFLPKHYIHLAYKLQATSFILVRVTVLSETYFSYKATNPQHCCALKLTVTHRERC